MVVGLTEKKKCSGALLVHHTAKILLNISLDCAIFFVILRLAPLYVYTYRSIKDT